jgi:GDP-D-mannose 3', 5'-epimerase
MKNEQSRVRPDDRIVVTGAGGFIGGHLVCDLYRRGFRRIRAVDKKPFSQWYQRISDLENLSLDCSDAVVCEQVCEGAVEVYNLAADMGGMGFIERYRVECLRSVLINTHMIEAAYRAGASRYFFSSSACVYNTNLQDHAAVTPLKESDAYPAMAERGYGWEKLISEMFCQEYWAERGMRTFIARFHNVYGPNGTWDGGREKVPAAVCRKVAQAVARGENTIEIWGDGEQTRSFTYIDDCVYGIERIMQTDALSGTPINLGSSEMVSINQLVDIVEEIAGVKLTRRYDLSAPRGVVGRNSDNAFIREVLGWEPSTSLRMGMAETYDWIRQQTERQSQGEAVVV